MEISMKKDYMKFKFQFLIGISNIELKKVKEK